MAKKTSSAALPGALTAAEQAALSAQQARGTTRTPSAVLTALFPDRIDVGGLPLRPLSLGDFILLEKIDSPILELDGVEEPEIGPLDLAAAIYLLATPFAQVAEQLNGGRHAFDQAVLAFASRVPAGEVLAAGAKVRAAIAAGFATALPGGEKKTPATPASAGA